MSTTKTKATTYCVFAYSDTDGKQTCYARSASLLKAIAAGKRLFNSPKIASMNSRRNGVWIENQHGKTVVDLTEARRSEHHATLHRQRARGY